MSTNKRPNDFAARLQRIEEHNKRAGDAPAKPSRKDITYDRGGAPENNALRNAVIWLVIVAGMGSGGYFALKAVPPELSASFTSIGSALSGTSRVQTMDGSGAYDADSLTDAGTRGGSAQTPAVASNLPDPVMLSDIVTSAALPDDTTLIGQITPFDRNDQCNLRRPLDTEQVVNVRLENGTLPTPVRAFSDSDLVDQLTRNVTAVTGDGRPYDGAAQVTGDLAGVDVFLTDTSAPIYLVLQNRGKGIIWNIQTAPGVSLAHVAIVSSSLSGLVSPPDDATFEALLVSDFVPAHAFGADDRIRSCMIRPWRQPQPDWDAVKRAERDSLYGNQMHSYTKGYEAYNVWYTGTLGVDAGTNLVSVETAAHVHFGPLPAQPFGYRGMDGRDVHMMRTDHMFSGDPVTVQNMLDTLHDDLLRAAVGGDIALLDPAPVERTTP